VSIAGGTITDNFAPYGLHIYVVPAATTNQPPTVATSAKATPSPVTGTSTALSVLGADDGGESKLTYTWAVTAGPSGVTFSGATNGTNASKNITTNFTQAGNYTFTVTIKDAGGLTVTSSTPTVTVSQTLTTISVTPASATVAINGTQQFSASGKDQFGNALTSQPTFAWSVSGGPGSISTGGLYTAAGLGSRTVQAMASGVSGTATVTNLDNFNRANSGNLGSNWQVPRSFQSAASHFQYRRPASSGFQLSSQKAVSFTAPGAPFAAAQAVGLSLLNPTVQADVTLGSATAIGLFARAQSNGDAYVAVLISGKAQIWLFHGATGAITVLGTATYTATPPTTLKFTVTGSGTSTTLSLTDGTANLSLTVTGSTLTTLNSAGGVGLFAQGTGGTADNFSVN
jgi:hypothetical protein